MSGDRVLFPALEVVEDGGNEGGGGEKALPHCFFRRTRIFFIPNGITFTKK